MPEASLDLICRTRLPLSFLTLLHASTFRPLVLPLPLTLPFAVCLPLESCRSLLSPIGWHRHRFSSLEAPSRPSTSRVRRLETVLSLYAELCFPLFVASDNSQIVATGLRTSNASVGIGMQRSTVAVYSSIFSCDSRGPAISGYGFFVGTGLTLSACGSASTSAINFVGGGADSSFEFTDSQLLLPATATAAAPLVLRGLTTVIISNVTIAAPAASSTPLVLASKISQFSDATISDLRFAHVAASASDLGAFLILSSTTASPVDLSRVIFVDPKGAVGRKLNITTLGPIYAEDIEVASISSGPVDLWAKGSSVDITLNDDISAELSIYAEATSGSGIQVECGSVSARLYNLTAQSPLLTIGGYIDVQGFLNASATSVQGVSAASYLRFQSATFQASTVSVSQLDLVAMFPNTTNVPQLPQFNLTSTGRLVNDGVLNVVNLVVNGPGPFVNADFLRINGTISGSAPLQATEASILEFSVKSGSSHGKIINPVSSIAGVVRVQATASGFQGVVFGELLPLIAPNGATANLGSLTTEKSSEFANVDYAFFTTSTTAYLGFTRSPQPVATSISFALVDSSSNFIVGQSIGSTLFISSNGSYVHVIFTANITGEAAVNSSDLVLSPSSALSSFVSLNSTMNADNSTTHLFVARLNRGVAPLNVSLESSRSNRFGQLWSGSITREIVWIVDAPSLSSPSPANSSSVGKQFSVSLISALPVEVIDTQSVPPIATITLVSSRKRFAASAVHATVNVTSAYEGPLQLRLLLRGITGLEAWYSLSYSVDTTPPSIVSFSVVGAVTGCPVAVQLRISEPVATLPNISALPSTFTVAFSPIPALPDSQFSLQVSSPSCNLPVTLSIASPFYDIAGNRWDQSLGVLTINQSAAAPFNAPLAAPSQSSSPVAASLPAAATAPVIAPSSGTSVPVDIPSPSSSTSSAPQSASNSGSDGSGLSTTAQALIGVFVTIGIILLILLVVFLVLRAKIRNETRVPRRSTSEAQLKVVAAAEEEQAEAEAEDVARTEETEEASQANSESASPTTASNAESSGRGESDGAEESATSSNGSETD